MRKNTPHIKLASLSTVAEDHTGRLAAFVTADELRPTLLFRSDLDAIVRELAADPIHKRLFRQRTATRLVRLLMAEAEAEQDALSGTVAQSKAFLSATRRKAKAVIPFPIAHVWQMVT